MTRRPARVDRRPARALAATALLALSVACGGPDPGAVAPTPVAPAGAVIEAPTLRPGEDLPAPTGPGVVTLTGRIAATNGDGTLRLDLAGLQRLGTVQVTVFEPWVEQTLDFQGVWLTDLLAVARADDGAAHLHLVALDNYQVDLTTADVRAGGVFLATRTGAGSPIPVADGGPTRIVFVGDTASGVSRDQWIWSLKTIDVR